MVERLYNENAYTADFDARVLACTAAGDGFAVVLDRTAFFPEGGGQGGDRGYIGDAEVTDTVERGGEVLHLTRTAVPVGEVLPCKIDFALRYERMQCHSGEHIVSGLIHSLYGYNNVGFHLGDEEMTVDYDGVLDEDAQRAVELAANRAVYENLAIRCFFPAPAEAAALDYRSKLDITEGLRLVEIPGYDLCACCAPHVARTGEIGIIKLLDSIHYKGGVRIRMLCGLRALRDYQAKFAAARRISAALSAKQCEIPEAVERLCGSLETAKRDAAALRRALGDRIVASLGEIAGDFCVFEPLLDTGAMRTLAAAGAKKCGGVFAVFAGSDADGYTYVAASDAVNMRDYAKEMNRALDGRGGGNAQIICGSVAAARSAIEAYFKRE